MSVTVRPHPPDLFDSAKRHLFVFAHQDDDLPFAGILQRALPKSEVVWFTNGDGLAPEAGMDPEEYAEMRTYESIAALAIMGYQRDQLTFVGHSEISNYRLFVELARVPALSAVEQPQRHHVHEIVSSMDACLVPKVEQADVVWTLAWQGGHPEHDLAHYFARRVVDAVGKRQGRTIPLFELPAYELTFLVPLRFPPWKAGTAHRIKLTDRELKIKEAAFKAYKSQTDITFAFKRLITLYGAISALRLKPFGFRGFARQEEFGPVPKNRHYTVSPHSIELLDYMFEDYEGERVPFYGAVARFVHLTQAIPVP